MVFVKNIFLVLNILLLNIALIANTSYRGTPFVKNYKRIDYQAGSQTWEIQQGSNGIMYFANNNGLLEFDGIEWNVYKLPNKSILRSIKSGEDGIIYAGGFNELGYFEVGEMGKAVYTSILDLIPKEFRDFGDVWKIYQHPDGIIFQTYYQIMFYKDDTVNIIEAPSIFHFSYNVNNEYYVNDMEKGLLRYAMGDLFPLNGMEALKGEEIWGILPYDNKLLISTSSNGTYFYNGNSLKPITNKSTPFLKKNQIYCSVLINDDIAFGTIQDGILICDKDGNSIYQLNKGDGLQNNTILCMKLDFLGNLWLGTDHGIDYIEINSPLSQITDNYGLSAGYAAHILDDRLYLGTNQGLFTQGKFDHGSDERSPMKMNLIEETKGQVWSLREIDGQLFCGHNNGSFIINDTSALKISDIQGAWMFSQVPDNADKIIGGTYTGLSLFKKVDGIWKFIKQLSGFSESARAIEFDNDGSLWMAHGYKGVFHIFFNSDYDSIVNVNFYNAQNSNLPLQVTGIVKIGDKILFPSSDGILEYSVDLDNFLNNNKYNRIFEDKPPQTIKKDKSDNLWYFSGNNVGVLRQGEDGNYMDVTLPFKEIAGKFIYSFEMVYPYNNDNVFFGVEDGFIHYNPSISKVYDYSFSCYLKSMHTFNPDSVYIIPIESDEKDIVLDYKNNSLEFSFSANDYENPDNILFSTILEGNDKEWSSWQKRNTRTYTNLYEGKYTFNVRAKNTYGTITSEQSFSFSIKPPFLRSFYAYIIYTFIFFIIILLIRLFIKRRFIKAKRKSEKVQQELYRRKEAQLKQEGLEAEKEIIRMRNDKLREGIKQKDKELANSTMEMLHKNEMLITLRDELKRLSKLRGDNQQYDVTRLVRSINKEIDNEKQWQVFETHFESVHEEFLQRIKIKYPKLTPRELKLCAYLRMNISSKEISVLMNISTRGVEISRYRLRKKLGLSRDINLTDFILSF